MTTLNGPAAITVAAQADKLSEALGKPINVTALDEPAFRQTLTQFGLPEFVVEMSATLELHNLEGLSAGGSGDFEVLVGRAPESFASWVDANGDLLRAVAASGTA